MGNQNIAHFLILLLNLGTLLTTSIACPNCPYPPTTDPKHPPQVPGHPVVKPPTMPKPPIVPPPVVHPPIVHPPITPTHPKPPTQTPHTPLPPSPPSQEKPPVVKPPTHVPNPPHTNPNQPPHRTKHPNPPATPNPPIVHPPITPKPPTHQTPSPPVETPCPPPPPPTAQETCPIDTLKLDACVDVLGGLIHIGIGSSAKDTCCPVLEGLVDLDAAICLCTTIQARLLNVNILIPIALQVLVSCGKNPPPGFHCPA